MVGSKNAQCRLVASVVGHRGLGANTLRNDVMKHDPGDEVLRQHRLCAQCGEGGEREGGGVRFRENSLRGCLAEKTFVEVDCQRSKDGVVCLWHDDEVLLKRPLHDAQGMNNDDEHQHARHMEEEDGNERTISVRVRDITSECLAKDIANERLMRRYRRNTNDLAGTGDLVQWTDAATSSSLSSQFLHKQQQKQQDKDKRFGNADTLGRLLREAPARMGVNIEMKLVADGEAGELSNDQMQKEQVKLEIRLLVSAIHEEVQRYVCECNDGNAGLHGASPWCRPIVYSSFSPECCILMHEMLQATADSSIGCGGCVHFLTDGKAHHPDERRRTFAAAVAFAQAQGLCGIVCEASVLLDEERQRPGAVAEAACTMSIATYGRANNDEKHVMHQMALGVNCIITDFPHELRRILASQTHDVEQ